MKRLRIEVFGLNTNDNQWDYRNSFHASEITMMGLKSDEKGKVPAFMILDEDKSVVIMELSDFKKFHISCSAGTRLHAVTSMDRKCDDVIGLDICSGGAVLKFSGGGFLETKFLKYLGAIPVMEEKRPPLSPILEA